MFNVTKHLPKIVTLLLEGKPTEAKEALLSMW